MVASKLWELTNKGTEWVYGASPSTGSGNEASLATSSASAVPSQTPDSPSSSLYAAANFCWDRASGSFQYATESSYSTLSSLLSAVYPDDSMFSSSNKPTSGLPGLERSNSPSVGDIPLLRRLSEQVPVWSMRPAVMFENPYSLVRGQQEAQGSSMSAVRSLLTLVPTDEFERLETVREDAPLDEDKVGDLTEASLESSWIEQKLFVPPPAARMPQSPCETASQLAEGTIRALRDIALDEAVELHLALRFFSDRWERPVLSWLEAGPLVWTSKTGYDHQLMVGQKVSKIQASLARRCSAIGELQQHLLRAGWHKGVAQWGVLGQGAQWAAVAGSGFEGSPVADGPGLGLPPPATGRPLYRSLSSGTASKFSQSSSKIGIIPENSYHSAANIFVRNTKGGEIFLDDPAFLAQWSVDAMALVRNVLRRASNGLVPLPYEANWAEPESSDHGQEIVPPEDSVGSRLPLWASRMKRPAIDGTETDAPATSSEEKEPREEVQISDLPLMASEVSEILNVMEDIMAIHRRRRLDRLSPPGWLRRNWFVAATIVPATGLFVIWMVRKGYTVGLMRYLFQRISSMVRERVVIPGVAIFNEVWRGRESFSDKKAREEAIEYLQKMIKSWLDETYPDMPEPDRAHMAETMDVSLIEQKKEESMKTFYEVNSVIRMSFIEMQYMKKEMMNALHAMDEMMSANDISMNLAAITPAVVFAYAGSRFVRFLYYFLLKLGKSREETYSQIRNILTDIERLLVMRDSPPGPPPPLNDLASGRRDDEEDGINRRQRQEEQQEKRNSSGGVMQATKPVLGPDDLGMLTLLVHECRTILWRDRRRFTRSMIRGFSEDLAELVGERGAVSVHQQLKIIERMSRTYPFLKVTSTGLLFRYHF